MYISYLNISRLIYTSCFSDEVPPIRLPVSSTPVHSGTERMELSRGERIDQRLLNWSQAAMDSLRYRSMKVSFESIPLH